MCVPAWCLLLLLLLCPGSLEMVVFDKTRQSDRWHMYEIDKGEDIKNYKRHSDGTFTSDLSRYLDRIKAKDFVQWLASKREGCLEDHPFFEGE